MAIVTSWNYTTLSAAWTAGEEQIKLYITENKKNLFSRLLLIHLSMIQWQLCNNLYWIIDTNTPKKAEKTKVRVLADKDRTVT